MTAPAAISATFADFKLIKGRKCCQLVFEVPIEQADLALQALGGLPNPASEAWCGIARLTQPAHVRLPQARAEEPEKPKRKFDDFPYPQQAGMLAEREAFKRFSLDVHGEDDAAMLIRMVCGIKSRSELATDSEAAGKFLDLKVEFLNWLEAPL